MDTRQSPLRRQTPRPLPQAALPSMMILPLVSFIGSITNGSCLMNVGLRVFQACLYRAEVQVEDLLLLGKLLLQAALHNSKINLQYLSHRAHVHHVLHEFAQLGFGTNGRSNLVERHRIANDVASILLQIKLFFVYRHATPRAKPTRSRAWRASS